MRNPYARPYRRLGPIFVLALAALGILAAPAALANPICASPWVDCLKLETAPALSFKNPLCGTPWVDCLGAFELAPAPVQENPLCGSPWVDCD